MWLGPRYRDISFASYQQSLQPFQTTFLPPRNPECGNGCRWESSLLRHRELPVFCDDDNSEMRTLDDTNARDPLVPLSRSSECEHLVDLIVSWAEFSDIAATYQTHRSVDQPMPRLIRRLGQLLWTKEKNGRDTRFCAH